MLWGCLFVHLRQDADKTINSINYTGCAESVSSVLSAVFLWNCVFVVVLNVEGFEVITVFQLQCLCVCVFLCL